MLIVQITILSLYRILKHNITGYEKMKYIISEYLSTNKLYMFLTGILLCNIWFYCYPVEKPNICASFTVLSEGMDEQTIPIIIF